MIGCGPPMGARRGGGGMDDVLRLGERGAALDPVTGSRTRAALDRRVPQAVDTAAHDADSLALIAFDIDYFKSVNDAYGHARGDEVLRHVADLVGACVPDEA